MNRFPGSCLTGILYAASCLASAAPLPARTAEDAPPPFGALDTPIEGSTVSGVIPVTGWALDDVGGMRVTVNGGI
jgi:hypothetical protein